MSIETTFTKFGSSFGGGLIDTVGSQGPAGIGFKLTLAGDYDIENKSFENINNLDVQGQIKNSASTHVTFGNPINLNGNDIKSINDIIVNNDIIYTTPEINNLLTTVLSRDINDNNKIKETDLSNLALNNIAVNEINQKDNGNIQINNDIKLLDSNIMITDASNIVEDRDCNFHIVSEGSTCMYLEADTDNVTESDVPFLFMTADGNLIGYSIGSLSTPNQYQFVMGTTTNNQGAVFTFKTGQLVPGVAPNMPSFINTDNLMLFSHVGNASYRDLDMKNNNISNVNNIDVTSLTFNTTPINDDTENRLLVLNTADDSIEYRTVGSLQGDIFDQTLNINDDVDFSNLTLNEGSIFMESDILDNSITPTNNIILQQDAGNDYFEISQDIASTNIKFNKSIVFTHYNVSTPNIGSPSALTFVSNIFGINQTQIDILKTLDMNNQNIINCDTVEINTLTTNTTPFINCSSPLTITTGNNLILSSRVQNNANTKVLTLGASDIIEYKELITSLYAESLAFSSTTNSATFTTKLTTTTAILPIGTYEIEYGCLYGNSNRNRETQVNFLGDGSNLNGESIISPKAVSAFAYFALSQKYRVVYTSATTHTFAITYRPLAATGHIRDAKIFIKQIL